MARRAGAASFRRSLLAIAAAITLILSLALTAIAYWSGKRIVDAMSAHLMRQVTEGIRAHAGLMVEGPRRSLDRAVGALGRHVRLDVPHALAWELHRLPSGEPEIDRFCFANEAGGIISAGRLGHGERVILIADVSLPA